MEEEQKILEWIGKSDVKAELLYRATRDGFASAKFHELCDDKGSTITFIKSSTGKRFGGYTHGPWKKGGEYYEDQKAFVFSLSNMTKHEYY